LLLQLLLLLLLLPCKHTLCHVITPQQQQHTNISNYLLAEKVDNSQTQVVFGEWLA
jgi:hypothetical protein